MERMFIYNNDVGLYLDTIQKTILDYKPCLRIMSCEHKNRSIVISFRNNEFLDFIYNDIIDKLRNGYKFYDINENINKVKSTIKEIEDLQDEESLVISTDKNDFLNYIISIFDIMKFNYDKSKVKHICNKVKSSNIDKYDEGKYVELLANTGKEYILVIKNRLLLIEKKREEIVKK